MASGPIDLVDKGELVAALRVAIQKLERLETSVRLTSVNVRGLQESMGNLERTVGGLEELTREVHNQTAALKNNEHARFTNSWTTAGRPWPNDEWGFLPLSTPDFDMIPNFPWTCKDLDEMTEPVLDGILTNLRASTDGSFEGKKNQLKMLMGINPFQQAAAALVDSETRPGTSVERIGSPQSDTCDGPAIKEDPEQTPKPAKRTRTEDADQTPKPAKRARSEEPDQTPSPAKRTKTEDPDQTPGPARAEEGSDAVV
ncbi:hypothetical protein F5Y10DRAFT_290569 [Nemania abortiva]|nr:hypothetical protein F5Y10DRAFT_290569 [Nemania abortiva]